MAIKIQLRRDTALNWSTNDPILSEGEPGLEIDTNSLKYGDGSTKWNDLPYSSLIDEEKMTTANVVEIGNLYFSNARAYANTISIGYAPNAYVNTQISLVNTQLATKANVSDLSNYSTLGNLNAVIVNTQTQLNQKANLNQLSTSFVTEGANLYYTDQRVYSNIILNGYASNADVSAQISALSLNFNTKANVDDLAVVSDVANITGLKANITDLDLYTPFSLFTSQIVTKADSVSLTTSNVVDTANVYFSNTRAIDAVANTDIYLGILNANSIQISNKLIIPKYTYDDMNLLTPTSGEMIFETSNNLFMGYNGTSWVQLG